MPTSLRDIEIFAEQNVQAKIMLQLINVKEYLDFVNIVYEAITYVVIDLEDNPEAYIEQGENEITITIVKILKAMCLKATHDIKIGGHVDIAIQHNSFAFLIEAKIDTSSTEIYNGYLQLFTRYSNARHKETYGCILVYCKKERIDRTMKNYRKHLIKKECNIKCTEICETNTFF